MATYKILPTKGSALSVEADVMQADNDGVRLYKTGGSDLDGRTMVLFVPHHALVYAHRTTAAPAA